MKKLIQQTIDQAIGVVTSLKEDTNLLNKIANCAQQISAALTNGHKVLLAGNGGSAADAQHMAGEFVSRFNYDRPGLSALALTVDSSVMTAISNDYGYEQLFARQLQAVGVKGDIFWAYSTSGRSPNILRAMEEAHRGGLFVIGFTGIRGWAKSGLCDISIEIPASATPRIQEGHLLVGHIICGLVEATLFPQT